MKLIVTISGSKEDTEYLQEDIDMIKQDCEDVLRGMRVHGVVVEVEVLP